jgi:hypothetical protein
MVVCEGDLWLSVKERYILGGKRAYNLKRGHVNGKADLLSLRRIHHPLFTGAVFPLQEMTISLSTCCPISYRNGRSFKRLGIARWRLVSPWRGLSLNVVHWVSDITALEADWITMKSIFASLGEHISSADLFHVEAPFRRMGMKDLLRLEALPV